MKKPQLCIVKKISAFCPFQLQNLKAKAHSRALSEVKKEEESKLILSKIKPNEFVILCDEHGKTFTSQQFSKKLVSCFESGHSEVAVVIGGAYGVSQKLMDRANLKWSLSTMVFNHHVAQVVTLEQIYRAFSIWKGLPYHNE